MDFVPHLFDRVNRGFFGPLSDPHAALYWEILAALYCREFEGEPLPVTRSSTVEMAERIIRESSTWQARREELEQLAREPMAGEVDPAQPRTGLRTSMLSGNRSAAADTGLTEEQQLIRQLARRLIGRLERSGWIHFQYRSGVGDIMGFHPAAARIMEALLRVARDEQPIFQGYVHAIAAVLDGPSFARQPGIALGEARKQTLELVRELKILERNIHLFTQRVLDEAASAFAVLEEGLDRYQRSIMASYHRLKTVDNVYRQRSAILRRLSEIERDDLALNSAAEWLAEQRGLSLAQAAAEVRHDLDLIRSQFDAVPALLDSIDVRNARFSGVALRRLRYLLYQDRLIESQLEYLVEMLVRDSTPTFELDVDLYRCELIGDDFLYRSPRQRVAAGAQLLDVSPAASPHEIRRRMAGRIQRRFSRKRVQEYVTTLLDGRSSIGIDELPVASDEEYLRLLFITQYGLDGRSSFHVVHQEGRLRSGLYEYPAGHIAAGSKGRER
ncbi:MAG: DUF5716 family protein [Acidobacteriia bacterium]|nr:DUF5716 family protein [Terriglobia bacterium]